MFKTVTFPVFIWEGNLVFLAKGKTYIESVYKRVHKSRMTKCLYGTPCVQLRVTFLAPVIWKWLLDLWKIYAPVF
jgi:hypothetical protein